MTAEADDAVFAQYWCLPIVLQEHLPLARPLRTMVANYIVDIPTILKDLQWYAQYQSDEIDWQLQKYYKTVQRCILCLSPAEAEDLLCIEHTTLRFCQCCIHEHVQRKLFTVDQFTAVVSRRLE